MSSNALNRVNDLFHRALEHSPNTREDFLKTACGADHSLFAEVRDLLEVYQEGETSRTPNCSRSPAGTRFGAYEIVRLIGIGGMGRVYLGRHADGAFTRDVAIKVIEVSDPSPELVARFEMERRMLASLRHPCIAQLFDAGQNDHGQLYFVMEYIDGLPITDYCERRTLPLRTRIALFIRVCEAVEEAHRCLIVHRDLKPGNILVDSTGIPKLLDFGIAKPLTRGGLESSDPTLPLLKRATPAYASPEQLQGNAAHTGMDVFSLGVVLHELVTGRRPSPTRDATTTTAAAAFVAPSEMLARGAGAMAHGIKAGALAGDLDAIILKALDVDVGRRYGSVDGLLTDLRAYLTGHPINARPAARDRSRMLKFVRRNPVTSIATAVAILAAVVTGVIVSRVAVSAARERDAAVAQLEGLKTLAQSTFALDESLANVAGATAPRRQLVEALNSYLASVPVGGDRSLALETAEGFRRLGDIQGNPNGPNLGDLAAALRSYDAAKSLLVPLHAAAPDSEELTVALVRLEAALGDVFLAQKSFVSAGEAYSEALALANTLPDQSRERAAHGVLRAGIYRPFGDLHRAQGDFSAALRNYEQALAIDLANTKRLPADPEYRRLLALTYCRIAALRQPGLSADEAAGHRDATGILTGLASAGHVTVGLRREWQSDERDWAYVGGRRDPAGREEIRLAGDDSAADVR